MPTPFPGMDPYLERPDLWPDVHNSLITALRNDLAPKLRPDYYLAIEERLYLAEAEPAKLTGRADVAVVESSPVPSGSGPTIEAASAGTVTVELPMPDQIKETYLEVRDATSRVVTVVEILSPTNKRPGLGRDLYEQKRLNLLGTQTHLVEIDLLRAWDPMPMWGFDAPSDYRILVSRSQQRPTADLLHFGVRQPIPTFPLPLPDNNPAVEINLGHLLHDLYDQAGYDLRVNYQEDPVPPLTEEDVSWLDSLLRQSGLR